MMTDGDGRKEGKKKKEKKEEKEEKRNQLFSIITAARNFENQIYDTCTYGSVGTLSNSTTDYTGIAIIAHCTKHHYLRHLYTSIHTYTESSSVSYWINNHRIYYNISI